MLSKNRIFSLLENASHIGLFLDYDGTLADFAPTPDHVIPNPGVIDLVGRLAQHPHIQVAIISGRRLQHVQKLVPVAGIWKAGTYGIELSSPDGRTINRLDFQTVRPTLEQIKPIWQNLIEVHEGFYLEDKGWSLAIHARFAPETQAVEVLAVAREIAATQSNPEDFRLLGGEKFLEIGPSIANKGKTVAFLLKRHCPPETLPIYIGDDDKDEEAYAVIQQHNGIAIQVSSQPRESIAAYRLKNPQAVHKWLEELLRNLPTAQKPINPNL